MSIVLKSISGALWLSLGALAIGGLLGLTGTVAIDTLAGNASPAKGGEVVC